MQVFVDNDANFILWTLLLDENNSLHNTPSTNQLES